MAVTSSTSNVLTLIKENGSSPTGVGGNIINTNFDKLDKAIGYYSSSEVWAKKAFYASSADNANYAGTASYASYANYAYSCSVASTSGGDYADFARAAGFIVPNGCTPYRHAESCMPYAVWGSKFATNTSGGFQISSVPQFGPFMFHLQIALHNYFNQFRAFAEVIVCGWDSNLSFAKCLHCFDENGNMINDSQLDVRVSTNFYEEVNVSKDVSLVFVLNGGHLHCTGYRSNPTRSNYVTHVYVTAMSLYPTSTYAGGCSTSYYCS